MTGTKKVATQPSRGEGLGSGAPKLVLSLAEALPTAENYWFRPDKVNLFRGRFCAQPMGARFARLGKNSRKRSETGDLLFIYKKP